MLFIAAALVTYDSNNTEEILKYKTNTMEGLYWYEQIPLEEIDNEKTELMTQLRANKGSSKIQFYRKVCDPLSVDYLLKAATGNRLIWWNEGSFILPKKLPKSVQLHSKYRKAAASIKFERKSVYIYGISDDFVARSIEEILCLKDDEGADEVKLGISYNRKHDAQVPTTFLTHLFLENYIEANPQRRLFLGRGCHLSIVQSIALASCPDPLDVSLECRFEDKGQTFVKTLAERTSYFGTLTLHSFCFDKYFSNNYSFFFIPEVMNTVSQISLNMASRFLRRFQITQPLASLARRVEYEISSHFDLYATESLLVVPREVTLVFDDFIPPRFHTKFLQESGNLDELGLIYNVSHEPSAAQQAELLGAIEANQNLHRVELGCFSTLGTCWEELLEVIGSHGNLRTVIFWIRHQPDYWAQNEPDLHRLQTLVPFMKENTHLDVSFKCRGKWKSVMDKVEAIVEPVRHQIRAESLTHESAHDRPALFGAAMTIWTAGDVSKTFALVNENTDLLCSLIGEPPSPSATVPEELVESRKRNAPSSSEEMNKHPKRG